MVVRRRVKTMIDARYSPALSQVLTVKQFCHEMSIGKTMFYDLVKSDAIKTFKIGRKTLIPATEIQRLINSSN